MTLAVFTMPTLSLGREKQIKPSHNCHPGCGNTSYKTTKLATKARVFELLNVQLHSQESTDDQATALCTEHYMTLYSSLHPVNRKCGVCRKPLTDLLKSHKCPDPKAIQKFLEEIQISQVR